MSTKIGKNLRGGIALVKGSHPGRRYHDVPRIFPYVDPDTGLQFGTITKRAADRRDHRNSLSHAAKQTPLFTTSLQRSSSRHIARGLASSIKRYSSLFVFSKQARIRAGKR